MINLYLDDLRSCPEGFTEARDYLQCINLLLNNRIYIMSFDHDLGEEKTGYDIAKYIVEQGIDNPDFWPREIYIHTSNPVGRSNIYQLFERYKPEEVKLYNFSYKSVGKEKIDKFITSFNKR
jgi:hypothetical protein